MSLQPKVLRVVEQRRSAAMSVKHYVSVRLREMWAFACFFFKKFQQGLWEHVKLEST